MYFPGLDKSSDLLVSENDFHTLRRRRHPRVILLLLSAVLRHPRQQANPYALPQSGACSTELPRISAPPVGDVSLSDSLPISSHPSLHTVKKTRECLFTGTPSEPESSRKVMNSYSAKVTQSKRTYSSAPLRSPNCHNPHSTDRKLPAFKQQFLH